MSRSIGVHFELISREFQAHSESIWSLFAYALSGPAGRKRTPLRGAKKCVIAGRKGRPRGAQKGAFAGRKRAPLRGAKGHPRGVQKGPLAERKGHPRGARKDPLAGRKKDTLAGRKRTPSRATKGHPHRTQKDALAGRNRASPPGAKGRPRGFPFAPREGILLRPARVPFCGPRGRPFASSESVLFCFSITLPMECNSIHKNPCVLDTILGKGKATLHDPGLTLRNIAKQKLSWGMMRTPGIDTIRRRFS